MNINLLFYSTAKDHKKCGKCSTISSLYSENSCFSRMAHFMSRKKKDSAIRYNG